MRPQKQLFARGRSDHVPMQEWGDCFRACVASILEIPIEALPNFHVKHPERDSAQAVWARRWNAYLYDRFRVGVWFFEPDTLGDFPADWPLIGTFDQVGEDVNHCVVIAGTTGEVIHDPWPVDGAIVLGELLEIVFLGLDITTETR